MSDAEILSTIPLQWCTRKIFWGSHGCTLGEHDGNIHECAVVTDGEATPCSQCRPIGDTSAQVRFWDWKKNAWSDWKDDWSWSH